MTSTPSVPREHRARGAWLRAAKLGFATLAVCGSWAPSLSAHAQDINCTSLPKPIVFGRGGSASNIYVGRLAVDLAASTQPLTVVYKDDGACFAMSSLVNGEKLTGTAKYWVRDPVKGPVAKTCTLPTLAADGIEATWGAMAQQATTCPGIDALPATVSDQLGPISGFNFIVPKASTQQVISAEAIYYIYGFGVEDPAYQVAPWTVPGAIGSRKTTSAAGLLVAKAVGIPLSRSLYGSATNPANDVKSNQGAVDFITTTSPAAVANPEAALAFCSTETADANRGLVNSLAFQAKGQEYGYWPDSTATAYDKINLRQGRYFLWNAYHFFAKQSAGQITDPDTKRWIGYLTGTTPLPDSLSLLDAQIDVGVIPPCAMQVTRDGDLGPLASFQPETSCNCYFETKATGKTPESCVACATEGTDPACPSTAPVCHYGFCEVK